jgi:signal transduction histidine kinase
VVYNKPAPSVSELVFIPLLFGICWLAGFAVRERAEQAQTAELRAAQAERERDALAEDRDALSSVEQAGRTALAEMRRLLAAMRRDEDDVDLVPQPGLDALGSLLDEIGRAGLPVRLHVDGEPFPLPAAIDLSAYRIVQEGLTNALKHARASHADVTVCYGSDSLRTEVRDDGIGATAGDGLGTSHGHGLVGIRERVKIYGGEMTAETANGGGFVRSGAVKVQFHCVPAGPWRLGSGLASSRDALPGVRR